jgi:hypothetical protein
MTLIEALQKLKSFSEDLYSIINGYNYTGYDKFLEKYSLSISTQLKAILRSIEVNDQFTFKYAITNISSKLNKIYYIGELNQIFVSNDIKYFDMNQAMEWCDDNWSNMSEYINDIEIEIITCMENYENIFQYMNQKFAARFYNR